MSSKSPEKGKEYQKESVKDEKEEIRILFDFFERSHILEVLEVKALAELEGGFLDAAISVKSTINGIPMFQTLNIKITRKAIEAMIKMLPKRA